MASPNLLALQKEDKMKLPSGLETDRFIIGVDWSRTSVDVYDSRDGGHSEHPSLEVVAEKFPGALLILESTAESYQLQRRASVLEAFKKHNVEARCFKTQRTAQFRIKWGVKKSDKSDAKVIYRIATETKTALGVFEPLVESDDLRNKIKKTLVEDRYLHDGKVSQEAAKKFLDGKWIPGEFSSILIEKKTKKGRQYRASVGRILLVASAVRKQGRGYREFRRQVGNYGNGYESMARSEHNWHLTIYEVRRKLKEAGITPETTTRVDEKTGGKMKVRTWPNEELEVKRAVQKRVVKAAQFLWRQTANG